VSAIRPDDVLDFWFGADAAAVDAAAVQRWFARDDAFDATIRERFGAAVPIARDGGLDAWARHPRGWLALLLVLDQFPRNLHRGSPLAFASDARALDTAAAGIGRGDDQALLPIERVFSYLPLEHAEDLAMQERCVRLFTTLRDSVAAAERERFADFLGYARRHHDVIARFGRFPHRNAVLGRASTPAELAYLAEPGAGF
jgi:uncharacterized protein (DUF924 family)